MSKRLMSVVLTASLIAGTSLPAMGKDIHYTNNNEKSLNIEKSQKSEKLQLNQQIEKAIFEQGENSKSEKTVELLLVSDGSDVTNKLKNIGAKVNKMSTSVYVVNIPASKANAISNIKEIKSAGRDRILQLPKPVDIDKFENEKGGPIADVNLEYCHEVVGMSKLWRDGYDGKGTKVAIIDTGVEPANEMLTLTTDGKIKISDYQDFWKHSAPFSEGDVKLTEVEVKTEGTKKYIEIETGKIYIPNTENKTVLFGYFLEEPVYRTDSSTGKKVKIPHDLNNNGSNKDKFPVVVMNYNDENKSNDKIFIDTNADKSFENEKEMGIYKDTVKPMADKVIFELGADGKPVIENRKPKVKAEYKEAYDKLVNKFADAGTGKNVKGSEYNFLVTEVENRELQNGSKQWIVNFGYDGNEHGTHVAGDAAGNGYVQFQFVNKELKDDQGNPITDGTLKGAAPGAQVIACRVFQSHDGTPQSAYMAAMEYACENGADAINMSLGSLPDLNDQREPSVFLANILSQKYGTAFCISAGNEGPATNSIGTPGTSEWAITVGAYNPAWTNYGKGDADLVNRFNTVADTLWYFSSNGPTEDGRLKPTIVAPGSQISSYPMWFSEQIRGEATATVGHGLMQGTSMSSPYTAGVVASMKQAINEKKLPYHPLVVKEALFEKGNKGINNGFYRVSEIGGGMIDPALALKHLEDLSTKGLTQNALKKTQEGKEIFIDRNDIVLKTEFNYTEKLDYKPEGLYVRSGDIPSEVSVTITNTKNSPVNVNLVKESYKFSNEWLTLPQNTLSLAAGQAKTLTLKIDKAKLNQGINSLMIKMDDPNTALSEGYIPVTVVNYMDLKSETPKLSENETREFKLEEVDKHYIRIPYGAEKVKITIERNDSEDLSLLRPVVIEPTGIENENYGWGRVKNVDKNEIILENPTPGTWEVDLYASRASVMDTYYGKDAAAKAKGKHKITAEIQGLVFQPSVVKYEGKVGEYKQEDLVMKLLNASESESKAVTIKSTGLISENANKVVDRKTIKDQETETFEFTIPENDPNFFTSIQTRNAEFPGDDLDLELCKVNEDNTLGEVIASSGNSGSDEDIYIEALAAGKYALKVVAYKTAPATHYDLTMQIANMSSAQKVLDIKNPNLVINRELAEVQVGLRIPTVAGKYMGFIQAVDEQGKILAKAKVEAKAEEQYNPIQISNVNVPKTFKLGTDAEVTIGAKNNTNKTQDVTVILALYNKKTNAFVKYVPAKETLKSGEMKNISVKIGIPENGEYIAKCFVWDTIENAQPLSKAMNISVE